MSRPGLEKERTIEDHIAITLEQMPLDFFERYPKISSGFLGVFGTLGTALLNVPEVTQNENIIQTLVSSLTNYSTETRLVAALSVLSIGVINLVTKSITAWMSNHDLQKSHIPDSIFTSNTRYNKAFPDTNTPKYMSKISKLLVSSAFAFTAPPIAGSLIPGCMISITETFHKQKRLSALIRQIKKE